VPANQNSIRPGESLGFVETFGLAAAIETADAMGKSARVRIERVCNADAGIISVVCQGDLAACMAAVDAGKAAAARMNALLTSNVIARPFEDTEVLVGLSGTTFKAAKAPAPKKNAARPAGKAKQGE
jgi:microcompartment protein CcmL/EutN